MYDHNTGVTLSFAHKMAARWDESNCETSVHIHLLRTCSLAEFQFTYLPHENVPGCWYILVDDIKQLISDRWSFSKINI